MPQDKLMFKKKKTFEMKMVKLQINLLVVFLFQVFIWELKELLNCL